MFDRENRVYAHLVKRDPAFIIGRRGSGKTAFLYAITTSSPTLNVEINTSTVVAEVEDLLRGLTDLDTTLFAEHISEIWAAALWHAVFAALVQEPPPGVDVSDDRFEDLVVYLDDLTADRARTTAAETVIGLFCAAFYLQVENQAMVARHPTMYGTHGVTLSDLIAAARTLLHEAEVSPMLLMDSIEDFQDVLDYHTRAIEGLFMQVGRSANPTAPFRIRFSFPAELWPVLRQMARNPLKDFGQSIVLQWSARELVKIAAHRFRLYLRSAHQDYLDTHPAIAQLDIDNQHQAIELLSHVLPAEVTGELGVAEETIAYILRHTQLLPRHLLRMLNAIWIRSANGTDGVTVSGEAVVNGIRDVEEHIVTEVCKAYELVHPVADEVCRAVIKNLPRRFSDSDLHQTFNRVGKGAVQRGYRRIEERRAGQRSNRHGAIDSTWADIDYFDFKSMLLEIGCIGRQTDLTDRYHVAEFQYSLPHRLAVADDDMMCVHPLFSGVYQSQPDPDGESVRPIYPYGADPSDGP